MTPSRTGWVSLLSALLLTGALVFAPIQAAVAADTPRNAIQMMFNGIGWHG